MEFNLPSSSHRVIPTLACLLLINFQRTSSPQLPRSGSTLAQRQRFFFHDNRNNNDHSRPTTSSNAQRQQNFHSTQHPTPIDVPSPNNDFDHADDYDPNPTPTDVPTPNNDTDHADDYDLNNRDKSQPPTKSQRRHPQRQRGSHNNCNVPSQQNLHSTQRPTPTSNANDQRPQATTPTPTPTPTTTPVNDDDNNDLLRRQTRPPTNNLFANPDHQLTASPTPIGVPTPNNDSDHAEDYDLNPTPIDIPTPNNDTDHADDYDLDNYGKSQPPTTRQQRFFRDKRNINDHSRPTASSNAQRQRNFHSTQHPTPIDVPSPNNDFDHADYYDPNPTPIDVPTPNNDTDHADDYDFNNRDNSQPPTKRQKRLPHDNRNNSDHSRPTTSNHAQRQQDFHSTQLPTPTYVPTPNNNFDLPPSWENATNADDYDDSNDRTKRRRHKPATYNDHDQFSPLGLAMPAVHPPASPPDLSRLGNPTQDEHNDIQRYNARDSNYNSPPPAHDADNSSYSAQSQADQTARPHRKKPRLINKRTPESQRHPTLPVATCPFFLDYHGAWWNAQALFASDPMLQHHKQSHAWKILNKGNFMGFAETHSTDGHARACSLPQNTKFFWSHGPSRHQAGVGLAIKNDFLQNFNPARDDDWDEIEPGRVARLPLRGPNGSLDLYVCYFPTGTSTEEQAHKTALINKLQAVIRSHHNTLSILMGDWNFVMKKSDRLCLRTMQNTGDHDKTTAQRFDLLLDAHHLHELDQPTFTHTPIRLLTLKSTASTPTTMWRNNWTDNSRPLPWPQRDYLRTDQSPFPELQNRRTTTHRAKAPSRHTYFTTKIGSATYSLTTKRG